MEFRLRYLIAAGFLAMAGAAAYAQPAPNQGHPEEGAPVILDGHRLFAVKTNLGPFLAKDRAAATSARLVDLASDLTIPIDAVTEMAADSSTDIVARDRVLLTITDADAEAAGMSRSALAAAYVHTIRSALAERRAEYSYRTVLIGSFYTLLATVVVFLLFRLIRRVFPALVRRVESSRGEAIRSIHLQQAELVSADRIASLLLSAIRFIRIVVQIAILYVYLPLVLSFFPWTREYTPTLLGYVLNPLRSAGAAFMQYLPNLFVITVALFIAYFCTRISRLLFEHVRRGTITWPGFYPEWADPTYKIVRFLIAAFTAVVIFPYLPGSESPAFRGISIFLGVLFSLGSTSAVSNIVAGTFLTYTRAFRIGDRVRIADTEGDVVEKTLLATRVQTIKNELITVPNALVLGSHITNFSSSADAGSVPLILHTTVTIGYDAPWRTIHELLIAAALRTPGILSEPRPFVFQTALDDFYVHYQINGHTQTPARMADIYAELHQNIQDSFNDAGMEIMSPHISALRDGNRRAIPDQYLPKDYNAPWFRVMKDRSSTAAK